MSRFRRGSRRPHRTASAQPQPEPELLTIEKLAAGGVGFARRSNGQPVFVRGGALPGDVVSARDLRPHKDYSEARIWDLVRPSDERRPPPCRYAERCGGCNLMALVPAAQRRRKHDMVIEILRRTAQIDASATGPVPLTWDDGGDDYTRPREVAGLGLHYRTRVRLHIGPRGQLGFLAQQSHDVVSVDYCQVATERVNGVLTALHELASSRPELVSSFSQVEVRALGEVVELCWIAQRATGKQPHRAPDLAPNLATVERHLRSQRPDLPLHLVLLDDAPKRWREFVQGVSVGAEPDATRLAFAPGMFTQVNWRVNLRLVQSVVTSAKQRGCHRFLDLYCGVGNFSLPLLAVGLRGVGVESNPAAIAAATLAAEQQGLGGEFFSEDVISAVDRLLFEGAAFDLILLDPPRAGFRDVVPKLAKLAPKHLFICACDPVTFARDLRSLVAQGFTLEALQAFDMFPQTHHVECAAWLRYSAGSDPR